MQVNSQSNSSTTSGEADGNVAASIFSYEAQTDEGERLAGTLEASTQQSAIDRLGTMGLRAIQVQVVRAVVAGRALTGNDFAIFNQQLAQLTGAGLPVETGLRLLATDLRRGRLLRTIQQLAAELEKGTPLDRAIEQFAGQFPPLYGRLVKAGIGSGNLSAVLLNLGRHLELVRRLRAVLWRSVSYPAVVLLAVGLLLVFLGMVVLPQLEAVCADFHMELPAVTQALFAAGRVAPYLLVLILMLSIGLPLLSIVLRTLGMGQSFVERVKLSMPLTGPVLRANLLARWCDAARIGVEAGLDLPGSIALAGDAMRSPALLADGDLLTQTLAHGKPLTAARTRCIPATLTAAVELAAGHNDPATTLRSLSDLYERQAELRMNAIPTILTPLLLLLISAIIGFVILGLIMPLLQIINLFSGAGSKGGL
jgi:type II secretory pathway component PulF